MASTTYRVLDAEALDAEALHARIPLRPVSATTLLGWWPWRLSPALVGAISRLRARAFRSARTPSRAPPAPRSG